VGEIEQANSAAIDDLRASVGRVSLEVQALADRVQELVTAVESLVPQTADPVARPSGAEAAQGELVVSVTPLPELAMAAVAETTLRGLDSVRQVVSVERSNDQATFVLDVDSGGDLVGEMRKAMPVPVTVDQAPDGSMKVVLEWAWGRSATAG